MLNGNTTLPHEDMSYVECVLNQFTVVYNSSRFKFESLAFCVSKVNSVLHHDYLGGVSLLKVEKQFGTSKYSPAVP